MEVARTVVTVLLWIVSILLISVVLMQQAKSGGLSSLAGGDNQQFAGKAKSASKEAKLKGLTKLFAALLGVLAIVMVIL